MGMLGHIKDRLRLRGLYRKVFDTPEGREVLGHLLKESGITRPRLTTDTNELLVQTGRQQIVYSIVREVHGGDELLLNQLEELEKEYVQKTREDS